MPITRPPPGSSFPPPRYPRRLALESLPPTPRKRPPPPPPHIPRYLYHPSRHLDLSLLFPPGSPQTRIVHVYVPPPYLHVRHAPTRTKQVWGGRDGIFSDDSDIVALLIMMGWWDVRDGVVGRYLRVELELRKNIEGLEGVGGGRTWGGKWTGGGMIIKNVDEVGEEWKRAVKRKKKDVSPERGMVFDSVMEPMWIWNVELCFAYKVEEMVTKGTGVVYWEGGKERWELAKVGDDLRLGKVKDEARKRRLLIGNLGECPMPLTEADIDVFERQLAWKKLHWEAQGVSIGKRRFLIDRFAVREVEQ